MIRSVTIEPDAPHWVSLLQVLGASTPTWRDRSLRQWQQLTRTEMLGEEFERVIATGHQPGFWHPGILAKYFAAEHAAQLTRADAIVELVVDQDVVDLATLDLPIMSRSGDLSRHAPRWEMDPRRSEPDWPAGTRNPLIPDHQPLKLGKGVREAILHTRMRWYAMRQALKTCATARSQAEQFALAAALLREVRFKNRALPPAALVSRTQIEIPRFLLSASQLVRTTLWSALLDEVTADPKRMFTTYNQAVDNHPEARMAPLRIGPTGSMEVPFWLITEDGSRHRAYDHDLLREGVTLWPRALTMTALARLGLCDLFVHGQSGIVYDRITDQWIQHWLGLPLAPVTMVTATLTLDFDRKAADERDLDRAKWLAHHVPYNLDRVHGFDEAARQRRDLLKAIQDAPRRSDQRRALFEQMRDLQRLLAAKHPELVEQAQQNVEHVKQRIAQTDIIDDRTWSFALYPHSRIKALNATIEERFAAH